MQLRQVHIKKREVVGKLRGRDIYLIETHERLALIATHQNGQLVTLGAGPVSGVAKFLAEKREPDIRWSECLTKSEADKELVCPLCKQCDTPQDCMCLYRDGYVDVNPTKIN